MVSVTVNKVHFCFLTVDVVGEIWYSDSSTCEMDVHFHFLMYVLSTLG